LTVSELAELSSLSKAYISQVKHGKRPPSEKLIQALLESRQYQSSKYGQVEKAVAQFLKSRRDGLSKRTLNDFYQKYLTKAVPVLGLHPKPSTIDTFLGSLTCSQGGKHAYYRALRVFYGWLCSPRSGLHILDRDNPMRWVDAPKVPKRILPSLKREDVELLMARSNNTRTRAVIALFTESGLRLSELSRIRASDIDWQNHTIRVIGKGDKEGYAPFGALSEECLRTWLAESDSAGNYIWGLNASGIATVLRRLKAETGLPCNPHTFRRTFACLLRKAGVDTMTIKDLGRWESLEMVQRYTRSVTFEDSLKFYKAPLG